MWAQPQSKASLGWPAETTSRGPRAGTGWEGGAETSGAAALTAAQPRLPAGRPGQPGCANLQCGDRDLSVGKGGKSVVRERRDTVRAKPSMLSGLAGGAGSLGMDAAGGISWESQGELWETRLAAHIWALTLDWL